MSLVVLAAVLVPLRVQHAPVVDGRNATAIARWEYRPGSTAYLVYSHAQLPDDADAAYEPRALVRGPASDVVLLKLSWAWLR